MESLLSRRTLLTATLAAGLQAGFSPARPVTDLHESVAVPTYRGNLARTGENPGPGPAGTLRPLWQIRLGTMITSSPAVVDNVVYVGSLSAGTSNGGALHAVNTGTGIERWRIPCAPGDGTFSSPAVGDGIVVVGTFDGVVLAASMQSGEEQWRFRADSGIQLQSPAIHKSVVHITDSGGHLYALDATEGREIWRFTSGDGIVRSLSSPAVAGGVLYCVDASRRPADPSVLHAFEPFTGHKVWTYIPDDGIGISGTPVVVGNLVYIVTRGTVLIVVDTDTGKEYGRLDVGVPIRTPLAIVDGTAYFGSDGGELHALDLRTGNQKWSRKLNDGLAFVSPPTVAAGAVYIGDVEGTMYAVDTLTGDERWSSRLGTLRSSPAIIGGRLYAGARNGALRAVGGIETGAWPAG